MERFAVSKLNRTLVSNTRNNTVLESRVLEMS